LKPLQQFVHFNQEIYEIEGEASIPENISLFSPGAKHFGEIINICLIYRKYKIYNILHRMRNRKTCLPEKKNSKENFKIM
jgi:hypothetical protein